MENFLYVLFFSLVGGLFSLIGVVFLYGHRRLEELVSKYATPFAAGSLLSAVFLDLLVEGSESEGKIVFTAALAGILIFFIAERFFHWFHHHHGSEEKAKDPTIKLIIAGDTLHNALDGVAIGAAFLVSVPTGIVTALAVAAHEIPQEIADFGLLMARGLSKGKALTVNLLSSTATIAAALVVYLVGSAQELPLGFLLGISAGFLLYIALSDIIPTIHAKAEPSKLIQKQTLMLIAGVLIVGLVIQLSHLHLDHAHIDETHGGTPPALSEDHSHSENSH